MISYIGHGQFLCGDHTFGFSTYRSMRGSWWPFFARYRSGSLWAFSWWRFFVIVDLGRYLRDDDMVVYGSIDDSEVASE